MPANITATFRGGAIVRLSPERRRMRVSLDLCGRDGDESEGLTKIRFAMEKLGSAPIRFDERTMEPRDLAATDARYISSSVPEGYDTLLGFISKENPEMLAYMEDPIEDVEEDHAVIEGMMSHTKKKILDVQACVALRSIGRMSDRAYPIEYLGRLYL